MKRLKEKLKAIWHIITDSEYIVFTVTVKNRKRKRAACLISDNSSEVFIDVAADFLKQYKKEESC